MTGGLHSGVVAGIPEAELAGRRERLLDVIRAQELAAWVLFDASYIRYFSGLDFLATERPVALICAAAGELATFVPAFEEERVRAETGLEHVLTYPEYPGMEHPMLILGRQLAELGVRGAVGADGDGYPGILGYCGPPLSQVIGQRVHRLGPTIEAMMVRKSEAEVALIRESARWCGVAHRLLAEYSRPGATEAHASLRAGQEATLEMLTTLGAAYGGQHASSDGASAGYRGQIGPRSAWAHAIAHNIEFTPGDVLVSETSAPIWGYNAELERTMIIGAPSDEMRRLFGHMLAARQVAFDRLRPGVTCADVDRAVLAYLEANDLMGHWRQHTGHAIGLRNHEAPFLDAGDGTPVQPGMVFTIEPGLYKEGLGGFRHSDTVVVRPAGIETLTDYPTDIESLVIEA